MFSAKSYLYLAFAGTNCLYIFILSGLVSLQAILVFLGYDSTELIPFHFLEMLGLLLYQICALHSCIL